MPGLFSPISVGSIEAENRILMAPLTRGRATNKGVPTDIMIEYYEKRAASGLIISEATGISRVGLGFALAPGIWNKEQVEHWKPIVKAVHAKGGKIINQLWHMGRVTHSSVIGQQPVSASATILPEMLHTPSGKLDPEQAHALTKEEIQETIKDYANAARNALEAGFDGVQVHSANGYLIDQFLRDSSNLRTDEYGGSIKNRLRFLKEVVTAVIDVVGTERVSVRFSPNGDSMGVIDSNYEELFSEAAALLQKLNVSMLELRETSADSAFRPSADQPKIHHLIRKQFKNVLVLNQEYTKESAEEAIKSGVADAISFGRPFIGNPDLVKKFKQNLPLRDYDSVSQWAYTEGRLGYIDF